MAFSTPQECDLTGVPVLFQSVRDHFINNKDHDWETGSIIALHTSFQKTWLILLNTTPKCWSGILPLNLQLEIKLTIQKKKKRQILLAPKPLIHDQTKTLMRNTLVNFILWFSDFSYYCAYLFFFFPYFTPLNLWSTVSPLKLIKLFNHQVLIQIFLFHYWRELKFSSLFCKGFSIFL